MLFVFFFLAELCVRCGSRARVDMVRVSTLVETSSVCLRSIWQICKITLDAVCHAGAHIAHVLFE